MVWQSDNPSEQDSPTGDREPLRPTVVTEPDRKTPAPIYPIRYSIGVLDPRFGIDEQRFIDVIHEAASIWEHAAAMILFQYDPGATFKINLRFDEREQRRLDEKRLRAAITDDGKSFDELKDVYDSQVQSKDQVQRQYDAAVSEFRERLDMYNAKVAAWNSAGGAPPAMFAQLEQERAVIDEMRHDIDAKQSRLNTIVASNNQLAEVLNDLINKNNLAITYYNGTFASSREFEKGLYNGSEIDIYEFDEPTDLRMTLVHELGHALGFGHVSSPSAIMFYKQGQQDVKNITLADDDVQLVRQQFGRAH